MYGDTTRAGSVVWCALCGLLLFSCNIIIIMVVVVVVVLSAASQNNVRAAVGGYYVLHM
jgi:cellulose synthase/poly-beta-1,6-N-acetylglucosamine synthase-like glycosyltransferase